MRSAQFSLFYHACRVQLLHNVVQLLYVTLYVGWTQQPGVSSGCSTPSLKCALIYVLFCNVCIAFLETTTVSCFSVLGLSTGKREGLSRLLQCIKMKAMFVALCMPFLMFNGQVLV